MTIAYQHRPLSKILAPTADESKPQAQTPVNDGAASDDDIPEKYRGKSAKDIIEMHKNSEKRLGQLQNEVGQLRGLVQDLSQIQRVATPTTEEPELDLSGDQLYSDPVGNIRKVVQQELKPLREQQTQRTQQTEMEQETTRLVADFPDMEQIAISPEFQDFVNRTSGRQRDRDIAVRGDSVEAVHAARRLLEDFKDFTETTKSEPREQPVTTNPVIVANERGHARAHVPAELVYESDVIAMINREPEKYRSPSFQQHLATAIREGRYVKQS